ncbi:MAG: hypothetical protein IPM26_12660 [Saprospiraceae bacterium]|nr:hypothetical protein [Saprospiraceae bacterium]
MTRYLILIVLSIASAGVLMSQSVGIGTTTPNNKAILDVSSTDRGILLPRLSDTSAVSPPVPAGLTIYSLADNRIYYFNGSRWIKSNEQSAADGHWFIKNDSILYTNRTYVGINTNLNEMPPQASLQVNGGLLVQGDYKATVAAPTASQIYTMDNSASQIINSTDSIFRIFDTGGPSNYLVNTGERGCFFQCQSNRV